MVFCKQLKLSEGSMNTFDEKKVTKLLDSPL